MELVEQPATDSAAIAFARIVDDCLNCSWVMQPPVLPRGVHAHRAQEFEEGLE